MTIELAPGELRELNVAMQPVAAPGEPAFMDHLYMVDSQYDSTGTDFVLICPITNKGFAPITLQATCHALLHDVFPDPVHKTRTYQFTIEPGGVHKVEWPEYWGTGTRCDFWVEGDWGEQTPVMRAVIGYYYQGSSCEVRHTVVKPHDAVIRYAQRSMCTNWRCILNTPPLQPFEQYFDHHMSYQQSQMTMHILAWPLLSGRLYRAWIQGSHLGGATRSDWTEFTTP